MDPVANRTCLKCGWVHFGVTRAFAEDEVARFNAYYAKLTPKADHGEDDEGRAKLHCPSSAAKASPRHVRRSNRSSPTAGRGPVTAAMRRPRAASIATVPPASRTTT